MTCANVPDAMQALHAGGVELIITDLMLPGESGIDLVQRLLQEPVQGRRTPVAVFSAGLTPPRARTTAGHEGVAHGVQTSIGG